MKKQGNKKKRMKEDGISMSTRLWGWLRIIFFLAVIVNISLFSWYTYMEITKQPEPINQTSMQQLNDINTVNETGSDLVQLFRYLNNSGGIPISIKTETNWTQFLTTLLLSSFFLLFFLGGTLKSISENLLMKISLSVLKAKSGRHIIFIKHTEQSLFGGSMISQTTLSRIQKALIKFDGKPFDLILHTPGGEIFAALFISRLFKEYPGEIRAMVPMYAMSGGTLLALSANKIEMSPTACMGPVDPQIGSLFKYGSAAAWDKIVKFKGKKAEDQSISFAMMGKQYTQTIQKHITSIIKFDMPMEDKKKFVKFITSGEVEHAFALTASDLQRMGLPVTISKDKKLLNRMIKFIVKSGNEGVTYV